MKNREIKFRAWDRTHKRWRFEYRIRHDGSLVNCQGKPIHGNRAKSYELMQYTGLKDKNDKEIYEGDILLNEVFGDYWEIRWNLKYGHWEAHQTKEDVNEELGHLMGFEIIGNIYENPELC